MFQDRKTLGQEVVEVIKQAIRSGEFAQGERIIESRLARDLGLSLTPVREAVRELVGEGILTVSPNRGPSVRILSPEDAFELYTLRAQLEGLGIRLAIRRSSRETREGIAGILHAMQAAVDDPAVTTLQDSSRRIHQGIVDLSGHERLQSFYDALSLQIAMLDRLVAPTSNKQHEVDWHRPIVEALLGDDPGTAEEVMRVHIRESYEAYVEAFLAGQPTGANGQFDHEWL
jgi:DNA-binding GntR family transcriptional regulator